MSRHLHLQPFSGLAGDMFLGLLLDLGFSPSELESIPRRLGLTGVEVHCERALRGALSAARVRVVVRGEEEGPAECGPGHPEDHHHRSDHGASGAPHHHHESGSGGHHEQEPEPDHREHHHGRNLASVLTTLKQADLPERAKEWARRAFEALFRAEAKVHGLPLEEIHLHEAGADDAMVDIAGTAFGIVSLEIDSVSADVPLPVGGGTIRCAHGILPVPGPAVAELLAGLPVVGGPIDRELITPTGAALLRTLTDEYGPAPAMLLEAAGHGAGSRDDRQLPNVLRGLIGKREAGGPHSRTLSVLETAVDDMLPQDLPVLTERLMTAGARDVLITPTLMKKGRPGYLLTVIGDPELERPLAELLLNQSTTLGVRLRRETRWEWDRDFVTASTPWGPVRVKRALDGQGRPLRGQPEFEDCRRASLAGGVQVNDVRRAAWEAGAQAGGKKPQKPEVPPRKDPS